MAESFGLIIGITFGIVIPLVFPLTSWALGRWYQGRLLEALEANEKAHGTILQSDRFSSTTSKMDNMAATSATLLHVSICVGPIGRSSRPHVVQRTVRRTPPVVRRRLGLRQKGSLLSIEAAG